MIHMIDYKVYCKNYDLKRGDLLGILKERRKDLRGKSVLEAGLKWAIGVFGPMVKDKNAIFVVPDKSYLKNHVIMSTEERCSLKKHSEEN
jgi:hypothetical protein